MGKAIHVLIATLHEHRSTSYVVEYYRGGVIVRVICPLKSPCGRGHVAGAGGSAVRAGDDDGQAAVAEMEAAGGR